LWWLGDQFSNNSKHDQKFLLRVISQILAHGLGFGLNPKPELVYVSDRKAWLTSIQMALAHNPPAMLVCGHGDPITTDAARRAAVAVDLVARRGSKR
jgi:glyoxylase-like metal-dependent hydrolase (beta-lactamase superfamily II)